MKKKIYSGSPIQWARVMNQLYGRVQVKFTPSQFGKNNY